MTAALEEHRANCLAAAGEVVAEPVLGAAPFNRRRMYTNKALGKFGFVPYLMGKAQAKAQAGGLPEQFLLVATERDLRAHAYRARGRSRDHLEVGEELARWDRDGLRVAWQNGPPYQIDVTLEAGGGEALLLRRGRTPWSEEFLAGIAG